MCQVALLTIIINNLNTSSIIVKKNVDDVHINCIIIIIILQFTYLLL